MKESKAFLVYNLPKGAPEKGVLFYEDENELRRGIP